MRVRAATPIQSVPVHATARSAAGPCVGWIDSR